MTEGQAVALGIGIGSALVAIVMAWALSAVRLAKRTDGDMEEWDRERAVLRPKEWRR